MSDASGRPVGSVARALALLDALAEGPAGVNALARRIEVNSSSASRLLATLERGGLVEREPGLTALAAPVLDRAGELVAILGLQGLAARFTGRAARRCCRGCSRQQRRCRAHWAAELAARER